MTISCEPLIKQHVVSFLNKNQALLDILSDASANYREWCVPEYLFRLVDNKCISSLEPREDEIFSILSDPYVRRRIVDHIILEDMARKWRSMDLPRQAQWAEQRKVDLADNKVNAAMNMMDFAIKVDGNLLVFHVPSHQRSFLLDVQLMGTANYINIGTRDVFNYTRDALKKKYSKDSVVKTFREVFLEYSTRENVFEWAVLVVCGMPKLFSLRDYLKYKSEYLAFEPDECPEDEDAMSRFLSILNLFDKGVNPLFPGSRFRMGLAIDQEVVNRLGCSYWFRKTMDRIKAAQQEKAKCAQARAVDGFIGMSSLLKVAIAQKAPFSFSSLAHVQQKTPYAAILAEFSNDSMSFFMPQSQAISMNQLGELFRGTFSIKTGTDAVSYCEFQAPVVRVEAAHEKIALVRFSMPEHICVNKRTMCRFNVDSRCVSSLEIQQCNTAKIQDGSICRKSVGLPITCLPNSIDTYRVDNISACGMCIRVLPQQCDALWKGLFSGCELIMRLALPTQADKECFEATLLAVVRNVTVNPDGSRSLGLQFCEAGVTRPNGALSWQPLGDNGHWALGDWLFKYGRKWLGATQARR